MLAQALERFKPANSKVFTARQRYSFGSSLPSMAASAFAASVPFEKRLEESERILAKHPNKIPVVCEKARRCADVPNMERKKFLVPRTMMCGEFKYVIHTHLKQDCGMNATAEQTIYLFVGKKSPLTSATMADMYDEHKDADGFLYMTYASENTLGATHSSRS
mmetsp:Transcript_92178/g.169156  ORF Transcript_92178/g.169156 Transcript_92178/m.169156 type:complete len:163 (+) Transcript_92178:1-489(+)